MRAAVMDRRLEMVAGPVLHRVDSPSAWPASGGAVTAVFVGRVGPHDPSVATSGMQMALSMRLPDRYAYLRNDGSWLSNVPTRGIDDGVAWVFDRGEPSEFYSVGRHVTLPNYSTWAHPMAAAVYDRVLTDVEATRVVHWLAARFSLSLSLSLSL